MTRQGVGIAIYPASASDIIAKESLCIKAIRNPRVTAKYMLAWNQEKAMSKAAEQFLHFVKEKTKSMNFVYQDV